MYCEKYLISSTQYRRPLIFSNDLLRLNSLFFLSFLPLYVIEFRPSFIVYHPKAAVVKQVPQPNVDFSIFH